MPGLQRLRADQAPAVLAFELANRGYFADFISDRGDEFFDRFSERHDAMLAAQEAGTCAFYVLVGEDGSVLGRFNLYNIEDGTAEVGYRVGQEVSGRGVATANVRELCRLAAAEYGLRTLTAATSHENVASQKVLTKAGFVPAGPADHRQTAVAVADIGLRTLEEMACRPIRGGRIRVLTRFVRVRPETRCQAGQAIARLGKVHKRAPRLGTAAH